MTQPFDVAVIGGGIVGLAHAWMAAQRKLRVVLLERSPVAQGASVRNFGMIWPIGQPAGRLYSVALRSRDFWLQLASQGVVDIEQCGSIHLAHRSDELAVLEEFCSQQTHDAQMLAASDVCARTELANPTGLLGGLFSPTELRVDPRTASVRIASWLRESFGVQCHFKTSVVRIEDDQIIASDGRRWAADRIVICGGSDLETLYPQILLNSGLILCKLQMLRTVAQPNPVPNTPHLASGLTLRHYTSFGPCPSLTSLRTRIARDTPELDRFGIHVMASAFSTGEVILGDSHEYGDAMTPFDKAEIGDLILRELQKVIRLPDWTIQERWHGIYAKHPAQPIFESKVDERIHIFTGTGGAGMTMSFGLADLAWKRWMGEQE